MTNFIESSPLVFMYLPIIRLITVACKFSIERKSFSFPIAIDYFSINWISSCTCKWNETLFKEYFGGKWHACEIKKHFIHFNINLRLIDFNFHFFALRLAENIDAYHYYSCYFSLENDLVSSVCICCYVYVRYIM